MLVEFRGGGIVGGLPLSKLRVIRGSQQHKDTPAVRWRPQRQELGRSAAGQPLGVTDENNARAPFPDKSLWRWRKRSRQIVHAGRSRATMVTAGQSQELVGGQAQPGEAGIVGVDDAAPVIQSVHRRPAAFEQGRQLMRRGARACHRGTALRKQGLYSVFKAGVRTADTFSQYELIAAIAAPSSRAKGQRESPVGSQGRIGAARSELSTHGECQDGVPNAIE